MSSFFSKSFFFKIHSGNAIKVSNSLDPDQPWRFVRPDLGANCLQRLSADDTMRQRVIWTNITTIFVWTENNCTNKCTWQILSMVKNSIEFPAFTLPHCLFIWIVFADLCGHTWHFKEHWAHKKVIIVFKCYSWNYFFFVYSITYTNSKFSWTRPNGLTSEQI